MNYRSTFFMNKLHTRILGTLLSSLKLHSLIKYFVLFLCLYYYISVLLYLLLRFLTDSLYYYCNFSFLCNFDNNSSFFSIYESCYRTTVIYYLKNQFIDPISDVTDPRFSLFLHWCKDIKSITYVPRIQSWLNSR